ncbi:hypothetical protein NG799_17890 [Laspinema sp. D1]|uniref:Uncharacterized protein n=1 Tax=Laspinema palackyanum D2a TaxID=2953684 RepID=A0ABT2MTV7_9CYAN|nr:hypothetical protein [Laspinema sp. D2a]
MLGGEKKLVTGEDKWEAIGPQPWPHRQRYHQGWRRKVLAKSSNFNNKANCSTENTPYHNLADCQKLPETLANSLGMRLVNLGKKLGKG